MKAALVIGCSNYDDPRIANLRFAHCDANAVASTLIGQCGVDPDNIKLLTSASNDLRARPTKSNIITALTRFTKTLPPPQPIERFFLHFSGHGFHSADDSREYLLPQDGVSSALEQSSLAVDEVLRFLRHWKPQVTLLFVDACRATSAGGRTLEEFDPIRVEAGQVSGCTTFWSCSPGQRSYEAEVKEAGVFSLALLDALGDEGRCTTVYELNEYLRRRLPFLSRSFGLPEQTPYTQIEPMELGDAAVVADNVLIARRGFYSVGPEIRRDRVAPLPPGLLNDGEQICGFDFGTTHSAIAVSDRDGRILFAPSPDGRVMVPSVVALTDDLEVLVGPRAIEYSMTRPERVVFHIKRSLGTDFVANISGRSFPPEMIASLIIRSLARNFEEWTGHKIGRALVSAPANYTIQQCDLLRQAFQIAGIEIIRIIAEPVAAGIVTEEQMFRGREGSALILDLGGGTLDVTVLEFGEGLYEIRSTSGDARLGGLDYDSAVMSFVLTQLCERLNCDREALSGTDLIQIRLEAERAKIALGTNQQTSILLRDFELNGNLLQLDIPISRETFRSIASELDKRIEACITRALSPEYSWGVEHLGEKIEVIVMAGQAGRLFTIQELLNRILPGIPIESKYRENAVALGLGTYARVFTGGDRNRLLLDALPTGIGIRCAAAGTKDQNFDFSLAPDEGENPQPLILLAANDIIPTKRSMDGILLGKGREYPIAIFELVKASERDEENALGTIRITVPESTKRIGVTGDVDANRTIQITITGDDSVILAKIQLNNFIQRQTETGTSKYMPITTFF